MALSLPSGTPGYAKRQYFPPFLLEPFPYFACVDCESPETTEEFKIPFLFAPDNSFSIQNIIILVFFVFF